MKKDWLAAFFAAPSIILDLIINPIKDFIWQEKEVLDGAEHDTDAEQGAQEADSGNQLQT